MRKKDPDMIAMKKTMEKIVTQRWKENKKEDFYLLNKINYLEDKTNFLFKAILWICFYGILLAISLAILFCLIMDYKPNSYCDTGEKKIAGDFKTSDWDQRYCAIQDCVAYNKFQKEIGSERMCVV